MESTERVHPGWLKEIGSVGHGGSNLRGVTKYVKN